MKYVSNVNNWQQFEVCVDKYFHITRATEGIWKEGLNTIRILNIDSNSEKQEKIINQSDKYKEISMTPRTDKKEGRKRKMEKLVKKIRVFSYWIYKILYEKSHLMKVYFRTYRKIIIKV